MYNQCVSAKALTSSTHIYAHIQHKRVRQGECGGIERGCRDKELRQLGEDGVGRVRGGAAGICIGGRVLELEETGGCSTARYSVTTSKILFPPDLRTTPLPKLY